MCLDRCGSANIAKNGPDDIVGEWVEFRTCPDGCMVNLNSVLNKVAIKLPDHAWFTVHERDYLANRIYDLLVEEGLRR